MLNLVASLIVICFRIWPRASHRFGSATYPLRCDSDTWNPHSVSELWTVSALNANQTITREICQSMRLTERNVWFSLSLFAARKCETPKNKRKKVEAAPTTHNRLFHSRSLYKQPDFSHWSCALPGTDVYSGRVGENSAVSHSAHKQCTTDRLQNGFDTYESGNQCYPCTRFRQHWGRATAIVRVYACRLNPKSLRMFW